MGYNMVNVLYYGLIHGNAHHVLRLLKGFIFYMDITPKNYNILKHNVVSAGDGSFSCSAVAESEL